MSNILAIVPNAASFSGAEQASNANINAIAIDHETRNQFFRPAENAIIACMPRAAGLDMTGIYALPDTKSNDTTNRQAEKIGDFFVASKDDNRAGVKKLPGSLQDRLQQQLSAASVILVDRKITVSEEKIVHRQLEKNCIEEFLMLSENVARAEFTGTDMISNISLLARSDALTSGVRRLQEHRSVAEIASDVTRTSAALKHLITSMTTMHPSAENNALLASTLGELGHSLIAMQDMQRLPDLNQLMDNDHFLPPPTPHRRIAGIRVPDSDLDPANIAWFALTGGTGPDSAASINGYSRKYSRPNRGKVLIDCAGKPISSNFLRSDLTNW